HIRPAQMVANVDRQISQVRSHAYLAAFNAKRESNRIGCIMRNSERLHFNIANLEAMSRLEALQPLQLRPLAIHRAHCPRPRRMRGPRHKNWDAQLLCE